MTMWVFFLCLFLYGFSIMFFPYIISKAYKRESLDFKLIRNHFIKSFLWTAFALFCVILIYIVDNSESREDRNAELKNSNYRYVTTFETRNEMQNYVKSIRNQKYSCKEGVKVTTNWYNEITLEHDKYVDDTIRHLFCLDENPHVNSVSYLNERDYELAESFLEYPSNRLITKFCKLYEAIVVDSNRVPVNPIDVMFHEDRHKPEEQVYLYCLTDGSNNTNGK